MTAEGLKTAVIAGISSDIGLALASRWRGRGWQVMGTFRTRSDAVTSLERQGVRLVACDFASRESVRAAGHWLAEMQQGWDVLVLGAATMQPIGAFADSDFDAWATSIEINFINQLSLLHALLGTRRIGSQPSVLMFAGGGTNSAPVNYSAYTLSKIALVKACELLDAELPDCRFVILGPGWVQTKIHNETLRAGVRAGSALDATKSRLSTGDFVQMSDVLDCCDWLVGASRDVVGGRNFSVAHDPWATTEIEAALASDKNLYKLRRAGNDALCGRAHQTGSDSE
jgi:NAD(P)-dependent dehydrogenase (short-subunit alcohol dehydrogenase family)